MSRASRVVAACVVALTSWWGADVAAQTRVKRAEIVDRTGFEKPLVAATILVPVEWQVAGGVAWNAQDGT